MSGAVDLNVDTNLDSRMVSPRLSCGAELGRLVRLVIGQLDPTLRSFKVYNDES